MNYYGISPHRFAQSREMRAMDRGSFSSQRVRLHKLQCGSGPGAKI
jgi:hypothetical protein